MQSTRSESVTKCLVVAVGVLVLSGCASSRRVYTPHGTQGFSITCSGAALNWGLCYEKAGDLCGARGYTVIEKNGDQGATLAGNRYGIYGGSVINRNMIIQCNP